MNNHLRALPVVLYGLAAICLVLVTWGGWSYYQRSSALQAELTALQRDLHGGGVDLRRDRSGTDEWQRTASLRRIAQLESLLERKTELLERNAGLLEEQRRQQTQLKRELDQAVSALVDLLGQNAAAGSGAPAGSSDVDLLRQVDFEQLRSELGRTELSRWEQEAELEQLRRTLEETDADIRQLQEEAERQVAALLEERLVLQDAAARAMQDIGAAAVPALTQLLGSSDPDTRRWAAWFLGRVGPEAATATPALLDATGDVDPAVQAAAREALRAVSPDAAP